MDEQLLNDLHKEGYRQGPGSDAATETALSLAGLDQTAPLRVADLGCGTGASTLVLARLLNAQITAVDLFEGFLQALDERATHLRLGDKISTLACSMDDLPFAEEEFDLLWSEGAIYSIGFQRGVAEWNRFLKVGGVLVVSEITWFTDTRPAELEAYWTPEYSEIDVASAKIETLEAHGYSPLGYFTLPEQCWLEHYYRPLQARFEDFLTRNGHSDEARALVAAEQREIEMYETYSTDYGYGVYIARKLRPLT